MKKLMLIVNPAAGRSGYKMFFAEALAELGAAGYATTVYFTSKRGDATEFAAEHAEEYDVVTCVGGDGTLSEVISGLMRTLNPPPMGYFPLGTTNDVASTFDIPKNNCLLAARRIIKGEPHPFDVGGFGKDRYFAYVAAFGAFTEVSYQTPQAQKKVLGHLAYVLQGAASLPSIEPIHARVEFDDGVIESDFLYGGLSNSTSVAGLVKLPEEMVCLGDGISELVLVKDPGSIEGITNILNAVITRTFSSDKLVILHTKNAKFTFDKPIAWTCDGEAGGEYTEIELCNYKSPIQLIF